MSQLNDALRENYSPTLAIVVYTSNLHGEYGPNPYYLESHEINKTGQLLEGRPLKAETIGGIVEVFKQQHEAETIITGIVSPNVLYYAPARGGDYTLIWHRPAQQRMMHFTPNLKLKSGLAMVLPTLYVAKAAHLHVFALPSNRRPGVKSKVHAAPYHNVNTEGRVCLGSAKVKQPAQKTFENLIAYWEDMFWGSNFSAVHNSASVAGGMEKVWKSQLAKPKQPFPIKQLKETKRTFQSIINGNYKD